MGDPPISAAGAGVFKVASVRDPFDRLASACKDVRKIKRLEIDVGRFMNSVMDTDVAFEIGRLGTESAVRHHTISQTHPFNCLPHSGFVGRYEADVRMVLATIGIAIGDLPRNWQTSRLNFTDLAERKSDHYQVVAYDGGDFDLLDYDKNSGM